MGREAKNKLKKKKSSKPYIAFFKVAKDENKVVEESKMPKALEEYFPKKKTVKILVRQHDKTLRLRKMQRKVAKLVNTKCLKPKYSLRDPTKLRTVKKATNQKRKSTDKADNEESKKMRSSRDFEEVANVSTTKTAGFNYKNAQNQTA